jgi:putative phosphoesterase
MPLTIGLISDTHGLLRSDVATAFRDVDLVLHAGDVGSLDVLDELRTMAPVHAVYGNVDDPWTPGLEQSLWLTLEGWSIVVTHGHLLRRLAPEALLHHFDAGIVVYGHTHRPLVHRAEGRLVVNPGAAGPRRFDVVPSVARLVLSPGHAEVTHVTLT